MRYCTRCVLPDTRPNLVLDESGVCNACRATETKVEIDWDARKQSFLKVIENAKKLSRGYDCLIPVSGGKDSTWQVVVCLEHGLKPLCVTWRPPARTPLGQKNLDNLISLGVDHIDFQISPEVEKKFLVKALERFGSTAIPMHMAIFNLPLRIAARFRIPLIIWGENSAFEYGGSEDEQKGFELNDSWVKRFGVTHGTTAKDWISPELTEKELTPYFGPSPEELALARPLGIFLGYYFEWDPQMTARVAAERGFKASDSGPKTGYYEFADIDDSFISLHHFFKWHKFGFTRLFDNLSLEIRNGRMSRDKAIEIIRKTGDQTPHGDIEVFSRFTGMSKERFLAIAEQYRNKNIWRNENGRWKLDGFLIPDWNWKEPCE